MRLPLTLLLLPLLLRGGGRLTRLGGSVDVPGGPAITTTAQRARRHGGVVAFATFGFRRNGSFGAALGAVDDGVGDAFEGAPDDGAGAEGAVGVLAGEGEEGVRAPGAAGVRVRHAEDVGDGVAGNGVAEAEGAGRGAAREELRGEGADGGAAEEGVGVWGRGGAGREVGQGVGVAGTGEGGGVSYYG